MRADGFAPILLISMVALAAGGVVIAIYSATQRINQPSSAVLLIDDPTDNSNAKSVQLKTLIALTDTPAPTPTVTSTPTPVTLPSGLPTSASSGTPMTQPTTVGGLSPTPTSGVFLTCAERGSGKCYCMDDDGNLPHNEPCDDPSKFDIAKGEGGVTGPCATTVISWEQQIMEYLTIGSNGNWSQIDTILTGCNSFATSPSSEYLSTYNVIDAYNLAGFMELNRGAHVGASAMTDFFRTTLGYTYIDLSVQSLQSVLQNNMIKPGYVMFLGSHVGVVNSIEVTNGTGWISILHSNTSYWLGVIVIDNWNIVNTPEGFNPTGFGGH